METVLKYLSDIRVVILIAVIVIWLVVYLIMQKAKANKYRKELQDLEIRYNSIKSVPLSFKLNKAVAISRVDQDTMARVAGTKDDFEKAEANLKQIQQSLADTEDEILVGKLKQARLDLQDLEASIALGEKQVSKLDTFLDSILEKETAQRQEVTELRNQFRDLKEQANLHSSELSYIWNNIEIAISKTEKMFSAFEEWMYASDFEKANNELANIKEAISNLEEMVNELPNLLEDARGIVPNMAEALHQDYTLNKNKGVYLEHLQVDKNLAVITGGLKQDLEKLKNGDPNDVKDHLEDYKVRLGQMAEQVKKESKNFDELKSLADETNNLFNETVDNYAYVDRQVKRLSEHFGLKNVADQLVISKQEIEKVGEKRPKIYKLYKDNTSPASSIMVSMKELNRELSECNRTLRELRAEIDAVASDEENARSTLVKLQVIMNQMQVKIRKYKLPAISEQYEEDMRKATEYIRSIDRLIEETPVNVQLLNATKKEAVDFVYKLYNNVNNVVATVIMVENTIVFGNRYRSTYADIDSELTRSELCFRNGEYTQALKIAIATIEKIHPGNFESMIKENAKGGE